MSQAVKQKNRGTRFQALNISSNSRRRVRALSMESRPKAGSSVSSGTACPSGTRIRYLLKMASNCASMTRCTSFSDGVVTARSAVIRYKLTDPVAGLLLLGTWMLYWPLRRGKRGRAGPWTASGRWHPPCICIWVENRGGLLSPLECQRRNLAPGGPVSAKSFPTAFGAGPGRPPTCLSPAGRTCTCRSGKWFSCSTTSVPGRQEQRGAASAPARQSRDDAGPTLVPVK